MTKAKAIKPMTQFIDNVNDETGWRLAVLHPGCKVNKDMEFGFLAIYKLFREHNDAMDLLWFER